MPNWCQNHLEISHEDPAQIQRAADAFQRGEFLKEFVPMPEGEEDWYTWNVTNWGTKWDVTEDQPSISEDGKTLRAYFESAWSPPIAAIEKMSDELGFKVRLMYCEEGCGFAGIWDQDCEFEYDISEMTADEIRDQIPEELDEAFGISSWREGE